MKLSNLGYLIKEGIRNIWSNRMMSLASIGVLLSCLVLTGAAVMASLNVKTIVDKVGDSNETTVYMEDKATDAEITNAGKQMEGLSNVTSVSFFPRKRLLRTIRMFLVTRFLLKWKVTVIHFLMLIRLLLRTYQNMRVR